MCISRVLLKLLIMHLIIQESFTLLCVAKDAHLKNYTKQHIVHRNIFIYALQILL